jgi:hypothetical protein
MFEFGMMKPIVIIKRAPFMKRGKFSCVDEGLYKNGVSSYSCVASRVCTFHGNPSSVRTTPGGVNKAPGSQT